MNPKGYGESVVQNRKAIAGGPAFHLPSTEEWIITFVKRESSACSLCEKRRGEDKKLIIDFEQQTFHGSTSH